MSKPVVQLLQEAQSVIDDEPGLSEGALLRLSNVLKRLYDASDEREQASVVSYGDLDVVVLTMQDEVSRFNFVDLPPIVKDFLQIAFADDLDTAERQDGRPVLRCANALVVPTDVLRRFVPRTFKGAVEYVFGKDRSMFVADDAGTRDLTLDSEILDTGTSVRDHIENLLIYRACVAAMKRKSIDFEEAWRLQLLSPLVALDITPVEIDAAMQATRRESEQATNLVRSVVFARRFVAKWQELFATLKYLCETPWATRGSAEGDFFLRDDLLGVPRASVRVSADAHDVVKRVFERLPSFIPA